MGDRGRLMRMAMHVWMDWQCVVIVSFVIICSFACVFFILLPRCGIYNDI